MVKGFYEYFQSNPGGNYVANDRVCHIVIIEANSADEANTRAIGLGIYFDGYSRGFDCDCCGDRWEEADEPFNLESINDYHARTYERSGGKIEAENRWYEEFGAYEVVKKPEWITGDRTDYFEGMIKFHSLEEYLQVAVNEHFCEDYFARIYHLNGKIKEIRSNR